MIDKIYLISLIICIVTVSAITFITDLQCGKIYNKHMVMFFKLGLIIQVIYFTYSVLIKSDLDFMLEFAINWIVGSVISILLYHFDIWASGDAKYIILMFLLSPVNIVKNKSIIGYQGLMIFTITFSSAFIFLILQSIYLSFTEKSCQRKKIKFNIVYIKEFILKWCFSFMCISTILKIITMISQEFLINNFVLIRIAIIFFMFYLIDKMDDKRTYVVVIALWIIVNVIYKIMYPSSFKLSINYTMLIYVTAIIFIRSICSNYNYKKIKTCDVKEGMILSLVTYRGFINSRVKGLPDIRPESIHSKITKEEAESVRRWEKSKYGQEYIYILRQIPFAIFISLGALGSLIYFLV